MPRHPQKIGKAHRRLRCGQRASCSMFIQTGALAVSARRGFEAGGSEIWSSWEADPAFVTMRPATRESIRTYLLNEYPRQAADEAITAAPAILDSAAPRLASLFTRNEIEQISAFLRSEEGRTWFVAAVASGNADYTPTEAESRALDEFSESAAGQAWSPEFNQFIYDVSSEVISARAPELRRTMLTRVCDLAADECPSGFVPDP